MDKVSYKARYAPLSAIKDLLRTIKTNIYCFAAKPKVQEAIMVANRIL